MTQLRKQSRPPSPSRPRPVPATPREAARRLGNLDALVNPDLFKALGDPTRARILACLCKCSRACSVSEIADCCSVDLSVVSRHLALLERAGLLELSRQGRTAFYRVRYQVLARTFRDLADAVEACGSACGPTHAPCNAAPCGPDACACATPARLTAPISPRPSTRRSSQDAR